MMETIKSPFLTHDHLQTDIARRYSNEDKQPYIVMIGDFPGYDIASVSLDKRLEIKCETSPLRTGNVCIEYFNTDINKASGILATNANLWLHVVKEKDGFVAYEFEIKLLSKLAIEAGIVKACANNSLCKIIPLEQFRKAAQRSFPIDIQYLSVYQN